MRSSLLWQKDSNPKSANDARLLQIATSKNPHGLPWGVVSGEAKKQNRRGLVLTCKDALVQFYAKFGFVDEGMSESVHGGVPWHEMRLTFILKGMEL